MPESRQNNLFQAIVEEYIKSANPVGSALMAEKYLPDLSSATIRNDMAELEEAGLIYQPHTSAGRIPTLDGYRYYLDNFVQEGKISGKNKSSLDKLSQGLKSDRDGLKNLAKALAEISAEAVVVCFAPNDVYYTGIANLFRQPEFGEQGLLYSMSEIIDRLDEVMAGIFHQADEKVKILIGRDNPFGEDSSVIIVRCRLGRHPVLFGILGPNRMDYRENLGLMEYSWDILKGL